MQFRLSERTKCYFIPHKPHTRNFTSSISISKSYRENFYSFPFCPNETARFTLKCTFQFLLMLVFVQFQFCCSHKKRELKKKNLDLWMCKLVALTQQQQQAMRLGSKKVDFFLQGCRFNLACVLIQL